MIEPTKVDAFAVFGHVLAAERPVLIRVKIERKVDERMDEMMNKAIAQQHARANHEFELLRAQQKQEEEKYQALLRQREEDSRQREMAVRAEALAQTERTKAEVDAKLAAGLAGIEGGEAKKQSEMVKLERKKMQEELTRKTIQAEQELKQKEELRQQRLLAMEQDKEQARQELVRAQQQALAHEAAMREREEKVRAAEGGALQPDAGLQLEVKGWINDGTFSSGRATEEQVQNLSLV